MARHPFSHPFVDCLCACAVTPEFIEKCAEAGVAAINKCICTDESMYQAIKEICSYREFIEKHADIATLVRTPADIEAASAAGKVGILMGFQGTLPLEYDARLADIYADAGVTIIQLTYNYRNLVGSGNMENNLVGLSEYGYEVIDRLNKAHVIVDLSHACEQTQLDALQASKKPVMISHANCKAIHNTSRNVSDEVLRAVRKNGGLIGCCGFSAFIKPGMVANTLDEMIDHIDHMVEICGIDHVAIGGDLTEGRKEEEFFQFNYKPSVIPPWPWPYTIGFESTYKCRNLEEALRKRGYDEDSIHKIFYGNFLRLFREVQT